MEFTGKIIHVGQKRGGTSARTGNAWAVQEYVIEETQGQYPKKCVFEVFGEDRLAQMNIQAGEELTVSFDIDAREYNGRWYNSIRAWKVDRNTAAAPAAADTAATAPQSVPAPTEVPAEGDDLPF
ncbi:MAG: DUF3127 domain-containing protein [Prevotellaceae bacterium]|nr:DUF3127 domain-containing protein [Prevotellaceae bacterium]